MDIFARFFDQMSSLESTVFLLFLIVGFLIGVLLGQILKGRAMKKIQREQSDAKAELIALKAKEQKRNEEAGRLNKAVEDANQRVQQINDSYNRIEQENNRLRTQEQSLREELKKNEQAVQNYVDTIDELQDQLLGAKTRNQELEPGAPTSTEDNNKATGDDMGGLSRQMTQLEERMEELANINREMSAVIKRLQAPSQAISAHHFFPEKPQVEHDPAWSLFDPETKDGDDLTRIEPIGPFLREKLHGMGISSFEQMAGLQESDLAQIARKLDYPLDMIRDQDWIGQARALAGATEKGEQGPSSPA